jgi:hypothetical protein
VNPSRGPQTKRYGLQPNQQGPVALVIADLQLALWQAHSIILDRDDVHVVAIYELRGRNRIYRGIVTSDGRLRRWRDQAIQCKQRAVAHSRNPAAVKQRR